MKIGDNCYLNCGGVFKYDLTKLGYKILKCNKCDLKSLAFEGDYDDFLKSYYSEGYFYGGKNYCGYSDYGAERDNIINNFLGYYQTIKDYNPSGKLLDVGCAAGYFVELMLDRGYEAEGIDTSEAVLNNAKKEIKERLFNMPLHKFTAKENTYNLVTMFDLIEHLHDPLADLKNVNSLLSDKGYLYVVTGDIGSVYAKVTGKYNHFYAVPQHLFFYNRKTISKLLEQAGFEVLSITTKGKWVSFDYMSQIALLSFPFLYKFLALKMVKKLLLNRKLYFNLGDTMLVVARKK